MSDGKGGGGGGISHAHVLVRVCRRINARMNLSARARASACPFLTRPLLHFKIREANDPWLTRSPAERGRASEGGLSLRARQYRTESFGARAPMLECVGVSAAPLSATRLMKACAHVRKEARRVSGPIREGERRAVVRHECLRFASGR